MESNENCSHLLRELFDVKVNIIIEKAKLKERSQEYEKLKENYRNISSEIVNIVRKL